MYSDAQAVKEIFNPKKSTSVVAYSRLQRWTAILSMYDYEFQYQTSRQMTHVDALSRLPIQNNTKVDIDVTSQLNQIEKSLI